MAELTGLPLSNASLLDESTAAAEAMHMFFANRTKEQKKGNVNKFFISDLVMPQTIAVLTTKASGLDIEIVVGNHETMQLDNTFYGALLQYPGKNGVVVDYTYLISTYKTLAIQVAVACDQISFG